jgi:hypothetical protein
MAINSEIYARPFAVSGQHKYVAFSGLLNTYSVTLLEYVAITPRISNLNLIFRTG